MVRISTIKSEVAAVRNGRSEASSRQSDAKYSEKPQSAFACLRTNPFKRTCVFKQYGQSPIFGGNCAGRFAGERERGGWAAQRLFTAKAVRMRKSISSPCPCRTPGKAVLFLSSWESPYHFVKNLISEKNQRQIKSLAVIAYLAAPNNCYSLPHALPHSSRYN